MHKIAFVLAYLASASHGNLVAASRKKTRGIRETNAVDTAHESVEAERLQSVEALAMLLAASNPSAAFKPYSLGLHVPLGKSISASLRPAFPRLHRPDFQPSALATTIADRNAASRRARSASVQLAEEGDEEPAAESEAKAEEEEEPQAKNETEASATDTEAPKDKDTSDDLLNSPAFLKRKLQVLEKEIEECKSETETLREKAAEAQESVAAQRARIDSDFANFKARTLNETLRSQAEAKGKMIAQFLPILDNFNRALVNLKAEGEEQEETNAKYIEMQKDVRASLDRLGLEATPGLGSNFDYTVHMAVDEVPSDEYEKGKVCMVMQDGYTIRGQLVREAVVMVSSGKR